MIDALNGAFQLAFKSAPPTGKRYLIAVDVSGSMQWTTVQGKNINAMEAAMAVATVLSQLEQNGPGTVDAVAFSHQLVPMGLTCNVYENLKAAKGVQMGSNNISLPFVWAAQNQQKYDAFLVLTNNKTNAHGYIKPAYSLR